MNKSELQASSAIGFLYVVRMLGLFMVLPVLPLMADQLEGATPLLIGIALGIYGLFQGFLQIPMGLASDRYGRKVVIVGGLLVFIMGSLVAAFSDHIVGVIVGRCLQGCGAIASTLMALIADVTRTEHRAKAMAIVGISIAVSFGLSLIAGPLVSNHYGLSGVFLLTAMLGVVGLIVLLNWVPVPEVHGLDRQTQLDPGKLLSSLHNADLRIIDAGIFLIHYLLMSGFMIFPLMLQNTGDILDSSHYLVYLSILTVTFVLMGPFMWLSDKPAYTRLIVSTMIGLFIAAFITLGVANSLTAVLVGMTLFFMAFNLLEVVLPAILSKKAETATRGTAYGIYSSAQFLGAFAGGVVGGLMLDTWELTHLLWVNAAVCVAYLVYIQKLTPIKNLIIRRLYFSAPLVDGANNLMDGLSSVDGIEDVVYVEEEQTAYLKVDRDRFQDNSLENLDLRSAQWL